MNVRQIPLLLLTALLLVGCQDDGPNIDVESSIPVRVEPVTRRPIACVCPAPGGPQRNRIHGGSNLAILSATATESSTPRDMALTLSGVNICRTRPGNAGSCPSCSAS